MRAVFLDRDGTINADQGGYPKHPDDIQIYPFAATAIKLFNSMGYKTIIVTNQSGIARGIITTDQLNTIHNYITTELAKEGAHIDLILYSPYFEQGTVAPYNIDHISRKPKPGMYYDALKHFPIKASQSYMIGDKLADIEFGNSNGLTTFLVKTGNGQTIWETYHNSPLWRKQEDISEGVISNVNMIPDFIVGNLLSAAKMICNVLNGR